MNSTAKSSPSSWNDQRIEIIVGYLLRTGVLLSASVVLFGGIVFLVRHGHTTASYRVFHGDTSPLRTIGGILHGTMQFSAAAVIQLGLLLLIATPVARVVFSAIAFAIERDKLYVMFTLMVLAILTYSLFGGSLH
jgi:uncharacterized membrane protein